MRFTKKWLAWTGILGFASISATINAQTEMANVFRPLLTSEYSATVRGDTASLTTMLADDLVWIVGNNGAEITKSQLLAASARMGKPAPRFLVDSVRATRFGDVATVEYLRSDHWPMGSGEFVTSWRALDMFARRNGRWVLERHTQVWLVSPAKSIELDSATMNDFVGHYRITEGYVDNVHFEGKGLVATASGQSAGARLIPVSTDAFSPDGLGAMIVFERDATGRVTGYVQAYPDGRVVRAPKLNVASDSASDASDVQHEIEPFLTEMLIAANAHDTDRFLAAYLRGPALVFAFNGTVTNGWDNVRALQLKWWNNGKSDVAYSYVGQPAFTVIGPSVAAVTTRMSSRRKLPSGEASTGEFAVTMVWQKRAERWCIVQVHESTVR
ncbi:MAG TPA: nuclear transport factor 2 family protein [Gemmatimonadaceae bacterium]|jgi:ketosteroid isomerase-like protein